MENMFSGKTEREIPKTLQECKQADETVINLHTWAERLENWGQILFYILIIVGAISTIIDTVNMGDINEDLMLTTFFSSAISWALYAFIEYCAYHVLALLISALASITHNTHISANVALLEASKNANIPQEKAAPIVQPLETADGVYSDPKPAAVPGVWFCTHCGTQNKDAHGFCKNCGQYRQ